MIEFKYTLKDGAFAPEKAHAWDAGFDLRTPEKFTIESGKSVVIDTGIAVAIHDGYVGFLKSKSGLMCKHDIITDGGVIDAGYTGTIAVKLTNKGITPYTFERGDKITQLVILPIPGVEMKKVETLDDTERGNNGFGSTGR